MCFLKSELLTDDNKRHTVEWEEFLLIFFKM